MIQIKMIKVKQLIVAFGLMLLFPIISFSQGFNHYFHTADIDNDGDSDIVQAVFETSGYIESIVWFENADGTGLSLNKHTVSTDLYRLKWLTTVDFDQDGDIDIIAVDYNKDKKKDYVLWFENESAVFQDKKIIIDEEIGIEWLDIGDLDQDGDMDIACAKYAYSSYSYDEDVNQICWYEQLSDGTFGSKNVIVSYFANYAYHPSQIYVVNVNGDSYPDIIAPCNSYNQFPWLMNSSGSGTFDDFWIELEGAYNSANVIDFMPADLDGDGDTDFLLGLYSSVKWIENQNGLGAFGSEKTITEDIHVLHTVYAADLDSDSDLDVMSSSKVSLTNSFSEKAWYENMSSASTFGAKQSIEKTPQTRVWASDIDGDGDFDYVSASGDEINWRLNLDGEGTFGDPITTSIDKETAKKPESFQLKQNYPNPFNPSTLIKYNIQKSNHVILKIYNLAGQEIETLVNEFQSKGEHQIEWQTNGLSSGIYIYRLQSGEFSETKKLIFQK